MNVLTKIFRVPTIKQSLVAVKNATCKQRSTRNLWHMCRTDSRCKSTQAFRLSQELLKPSHNCVCGCFGVRMHTKGERELVEFLAEEIAAERKVQKNNTLPTEIGGFKVFYDGAHVELEKQSDKERVVISFNVNHTVDGDDEIEIGPNADKPEFAEMKSKPQFEVDIVKGTHTMSFTCSFLQGEAQEGEYNDVFGIDELTWFDGEWNEKVYAVAGDVLDGYLYDLLMNLLEEKGVGNEFVKELSDLSTSYEHSAYIRLLEKISKFTINKQQMP